MAFVLDTEKRFWQSTGSNRFITDTLSRNSSLYERSVTGGIPVREFSGKLVARGEERNRETIPTPRFARRPSSMNSYFPAEGAYPQNSMADQSGRLISELQSDKFTTPSTLSCWKIRFQIQVSACSSSPSRQCYGSTKWRWSIRWTI